MRMGRFLNLFIFMTILLSFHGNIYGKNLTEEQFHNLVKKLKYLNNAERITIIKSLEKLAPEDQEKFTEIVSEISKKDNDPFVREAALRFLTGKKASCETCIASYKENLFHKEEKVRLQALKGIETLQLKDQEELFLRLLEDADFKENSPFLTSLIRTLGTLQYNQPAISEFLKKKYSEEETHQEVKRTILLYAGSSRNQDFKDILIENMQNDSDIYMMSYAINSLSKLAESWNEEEKSALREKLKEKYNQIQNMANSKDKIRYNTAKHHILLALVRLQDPELKEEILSFALDDDANTRLKALEYIKELGLKEFYDLVETKSKYDPSKSVKKKAQEILQQWNSSP